MVWSENFHFKPFPDSHGERERESPDQSSDRAPVQRPQTGLVAPCHTNTDPHQCKSTPAPIKQRSTPMPIAPCRSSKDWLQCCSISPSLRNLMNFFFFFGFVSFVFLYDLIWWIFFSKFCFFCVSILRNDIIYLFDSWENVRKCVQQVENVFSMVFSRTQPNTRKYFSKHFLKCNQTLENIFLSRK